MYVVGLFYINNNTHTHSKCIASFPLHEECHEYFCLNVSVFFFSVLPSPGSHQTCSTLSASPVVFRSHHGSAWMETHLLISIRSISEHVRMYSLFKTKNKSMEVRRFPAGIQSQGSYLQPCCFHLKRWGDCFFSDKNLAYHSFNQIGTQHRALAIVKRIFVFSDLSPYLLFTLLHTFNWW